MRAPPYTEEFEARWETAPSIDLEGKNCQLPVPSIAALEDQSFQLLSLYDKDKHLLMILILIG